MTRSRHTYPDRLAWLGARRVGASDIAKVLGISSWGGPWDVYTRLTSGAPVVDRAPTDAQARGQEWEPWVLYLYAQRSGNELKKLPPHTLWTGPEPWATATPDGLARDGDTIGGVEVKTAMLASEWGEAQTIDRWTDGCEHIIPPHYALQCYWQAWVADLPWVDLVVLLPRYELRIYRLMRDPEIEAVLVSTVGDWYRRHVEGLEPPEIDGSKGCRSALAKRFQGGADYRPADDNERTLALRMAEIKREHDALDAERDLIQAQLLDAIGDAKGVRWDDGPRAQVIRLKGRSTVDVKGLARESLELSEAVERHTRTGNSSAYVRLYGLDLQE